jgi:hypothetical protein
VKQLSRERMRASRFEIVGLRLLLAASAAGRAALAQAPSYGDPSLPLAPKLLAEFVAFVKEVKKK